MRRFTPLQGVDRWKVIGVVFSPALSVIGNQITFEWLNVPADKKAVIIWPGLVVLLAVCAIAAVYSEAPANLDPAGASGPTGTSTGTSVAAPPLPYVTGASRRRRGPGLSLVLAGLTVLGSVALLIWPAVVKHQLQS